MLNRIIKYSLQNRLIIMVGAVLLLLTGSYVTTTMEVDVFPDLNAPTVVVMTEAHGMAPEEVERLVTFPIETAVNGSTGIRRVRSSSAMGFSLVWVEFDWGVDVYDARQTVSEKLMTVQEQLPQGVGNPTIAPQSSLLGEVFIFSITADSTSAMEMRTIAEWVIRPRLLSVGGVAQVTTIGGDLKQYQVLVNPEKLRYYKIGLDEVVDVCKESNQNTPGGFINQYGNKYIVRGIGRTKDLDDIANSVIKKVDGMPIKLRDVAEVKIGAAPKIGTGSYKGKDALVLTVTKQPGINTIELNTLLKNELQSISQTLPKDMKFNTDVFTQADFIQTSVNNVKNALIEGSIFVIIILFLFLMNYRTTLISLLAIPLSLLVSILTLRWLGFTINTMSLGGMAIAIGSLVDDAIIDVENVFKRLRENAKKESSERQNVITVIYEASKEIRASILNATLIIIVAFLPLFFLSGMEGRMLRPLGISYIVALFASLMVAVTVTPVLCSFLLTNQKKLEKGEHGSWLERKLSSLYGKGLVRVLNHKKAVLFSAIGAFLFSLVVIVTFGRSFLPPFNEGSLTINLATLPSVTLDESAELGRRAEELLLSIPEIDVTCRKTGRAEMAEHSFGENISELDVPFTLKNRSRSEFLKDVRQKLNSIPGIMVEVGQPISHRMDHMLSGSKANIAIKLFGTDLNKMFLLANQIKGKVGEVSGIGDLNVEQQIETPQIKIYPRREMLARYGISINKFNNFIENAFANDKVAEVFEGERSFDMIVQFADPFRDNVEAINEALIDTDNGEKIPLSYVADIVSGSGPNTVNRENVQRKLVISVNVADRDVRSVVKDIQKIVNTSIDLPEGYRIEYGGQFESEERASRTLLLTSLMALLVIFMLLYSEFKNVKMSAVILMNLPLALIGGVMAIWASSQVISIPSIIGFITLFGIATRNGILLVSRYDALLIQGETLYNAIVKGSLDRLNPILMTALTAALALVPLAMAGDMPGNEIQSPMAIVILGGLLSATLLNIFVIPVVYYYVNLKKHNR